MEHLAGCPRCGQALSGESACPRCGVVFAKLRPREPAEAARETASAPAFAPEAPPRAAIPWGLVVGFGALLLAGVVGLPRLRSGAPLPDAPAAPLEEPGEPAGFASVANEERPPRFEPPPMAFEAIAVPDARGAADADEQAFTGLARRVHARAIKGASDVQAAEDLLSRHAGEQPVRSLAAAVLTLAADQERGRRRFVQATAYLDRATVVDAGNVQAWVSLMTVSIEASDWTRAEAAARGALGLEPRLAEAWQGLGFALMRQDRNQEAAEALRTSAEIRPDSGTQALLENLRTGMAYERGMTQQQLAHFNVRYDGAAHEAVGREILRALERHYATLAGSLDHQPQTTIPVILFSRESYHVASGVPAWAGGSYHPLDGRIRIPIGGLDAGLTADMDGTLIHELTHAFLHDRTRGTVPREINEGLAQYMAGDRVASKLDAEQMRWLADGRFGGVYGFYMGALSLVEYLVAHRGMGGMNDLLRTMGETGSVDEAFKQVHGQTYPATQRAWRQRLRQQHGS
ncbi:MAG TPA: hypothetical protein VMT87_16905 [Vicinamibacteria bacterium]|nr:hypothetical protein [Vicinamibacteria bacterium]